MIARENFVSRNILSSDAVNISLARLAVSILCVVFAITDNYILQLKLEWDDFICILYFVLSTIWFSSNTMYPVDAFKISGLAIAFDLGMVAAVPLIDFPSSNDTLVIQFAISCLVVIMAKIRWNNRTAVKVGLMLALMGVATCLTLHPGHSTSEGMILRRAAVVMIASILALWIAARIDVRHPRVARSSSAATMAAGIDQIAADVRSLLDCSHVSVEWLANDRAFRCHRHSPDVIGAARELTMPGGDEVREGCRALVFPPSRASTLVIDDGWTVSLLPVPARGAPGHFPKVAGFCARIESPIGVGLIVASGFRSMRWDDIRTFHAIASASMHWLSDLSWSHFSVDITVDRVREEVARDLHDSVAQSLAGAKFWLAGLASEATDVQQQQELGRIRDAIEAETSNVRTIIEGLRQGIVRGGGTSLEASLADTLLSLQRQWRIRTEIACELAEGTTHDAATVFALQQVMREAVSNAVRHGGASLVMVRCAAGRTTVRMDVTDNGGGFADGTFPQSLSERMVRMGGDIRVSSAPGDTTVSVVLKIGAPRDESYDS